jgi:hypothetical protein
MEDPSFRALRCWFLSISVFIGGDRIHESVILFPGAAQLIDKHGWLSKEHRDFWIVYFRPLHRLVAFSILYWLSVPCALQLDLRHTDQR